MKKARWILTLTLVICLLCSCGKKEQEQTEITLIHGWGSMEPEHVRMRQIYKDFEKEHPEIKLNLMSMTSSNEVIEKTKNMLSVGEVPDLIFTGGYGKDSVYQFMEEKNVWRRRLFLTGKRTENFTLCQMCCCLEEATGTMRICLQKQGSRRYQRHGRNFWKFAKRYRDGHRQKENR